MEPINLEDIVPQGSEIYLSLAKKSYRLRPVNLQDEIWLNKTFGTELEKIFKEIRMKEIARIIFHQLEEEDKDDFAKKTVTIMNEEGDKVSEVVGGAELLYCMIGGTAEKIQIFEALMATIGISRPMIKKLTGEDLTPEKKSQLKEQIGRKSLISSKRNMGGKSNTSSRRR